MKSMFALFYINIIANFIKNEYLKLTPTIFYISTRTSYKVYSYTVFGLDIKKCNWKYNTTLKLLKKGFADGTWSVFSNLELNLY